ncbi:MAG: hypothetical protein D6705_09845, partial [Deltaproteobacteria bacterium]
MCLQFQEGTTVSGPHMEWSLFERVARELFPVVRRFQPSVSGEPTMSRRFARMCALAEAHGVKLDLCTNATLLDERMRRLLIPCCGRVLFSFDGATKETFERIREGADFDLVCEHIRCFCAESKDRMGRNRAITGLACVLMRENIEELPALVRLAKEDLGVDFVACAHLHPVTEEMKLQSLVHDPELAVASIREAVSVAEELRFPLSIQPLDRLIAATARKKHSWRECAEADGYVPGLGPVQVNQDSIPAWPGIDPSDPSSRDIVELRRKALAAWRAAELPGAPARDPSLIARSDDDELPASVWFCDYLWNKSYVA